MSKYPAQLDNTQSLPTVIDNSTPIQGASFNRLRDAILAIETELGVHPSSTYSNVRSRLDTLEAAVNNVSVISLSGDVVGTPSANTVTKLQGKLVSNVTPLNGQTLVWNGSAWTPSTDIGNLSNTTSLSGSQISLKFGSRTLGLSDFGPGFLVMGGDATASGLVLLLQDNVTNGATAGSLIFQAANATGTTSTGGTVGISAGTGTSVNGYIRFSTGNHERIRINDPGALMFWQASSPVTSFSGAFSIYADSSSGAPSIKSGDGRIFSLDYFQGTGLAGKPGMLFNNFNTFGGGQQIIGINQASGANAQGNDLFIIPGTSTGTGTAGKVYILAARNSNTPGSAENALVTATPAITVASDTSAINHVGINKSSGLAATLEVGGTVNASSSVTAGAIIAPSFTAPTGSSFASSYKTLSLTAASGTVTLVSGEIEAEHLKITGTPAGNVALVHNFTPAGGKLVIDNQTADTVSVTFAGLACPYGMATGFYCDGTSWKYNTNAIALGTTTLTRNIASDTGAVSLGALPHVRSIVFTGTTTADAQYTWSGTFVEGTLLSITNASIGPHIQTVQGLWIPPYNTVVNLIYTNGSWRYAQENAKKIKVNITNFSVVTGGGTNNLIKVPKSWRASYGAMRGISYTTNIIDGPATIQLGDDVYSSQSLVMATLPSANGLFENTGFKMALFASETSPVADYNITYSAGIRIASATVDFIVEFEGFEDQWTKAQEVHEAYLTGVFAPSGYHFNIGTPKVKSLAGSTGTVILSAGDVEAETLTLIDAPSGDVFLDPSGALFASGDTRRIINNCTGAVIISYGNSSLWCPPGVTTKVIYDGYTNAWKYAEGSGGAFKLQSTQSNISATVAGTNIWKIPAKWKVRSAGERVITAMVGATPSAFTLTASTTGDLLASHAPGAAGTDVENTGTALAGGGSFDSVAAYNISFAGTVTGSPSTALAVSYRAVVEDCA